MMQSKRRDKLSKSERVVVRSLVNEIHRLRATVRADADLVDACCSLDVLPRGDYMVRVAIRCSSALPAGALSMAAAA